MVLGIEFGSTRIKSTLVDMQGAVIASGSYEWENILVDGLWSYELDHVIKGMQESYADLIKKLGKPIKKLDAIGISGMMHGYLVFDKENKLLAPFRTWRNTNTERAASALSELFQFNIPMRWSVAQYYESVLDNLKHVSQINFMTTLAGYIHFLLTGKKVLGANDASGMFPIANGDYDAEKLALFDNLLKSKHGLDVHFKDLLPEYLVAGQDAGKLTKEGALLIDPTGELEANIPLCPPEGDMGTGMIATNSIRVKTANSSLGTCANLTVVLEKPLKKYYPQIDIIFTPDGHPAALVHNNTCTTEINAWVGLFEEVLETMGAKVDRGELFTKLFQKSLESDQNNDVTAFNFTSGEPIVSMTKGKPVVIREIDSKLSLANFMNAEIYSAIATIAIGLDILKAEDVKLDMVYGHGGFFKTEFVGANAFSAAVKAPVATLDNAGEGGSWGIALLALFMFSKKTLPDFLDDVFSKSGKTVVEANAKDIEKFDHFLKNYKDYLAVEKLAADIK